MPYVLPPRFSHGDYPTAAQINKYKDGLDHIHSLVGDVDYEYPIVNRQDEGDLADGELHSHWFVNCYRYLIYRSAGSIHDPGNVFDTVSLEDTGGFFRAYDLTQIEWVIPGKMYEVQGVTEAYESETGS